MFDNKNTEFDPTEDHVPLSDSIKKLYLIAKLNVVPIFIILFTSSVISYVFSSNLRDIYKATVSVMIEAPAENILKADLSMGSALDRGSPFIENQIEIMKGYYLRDRASGLISDSIKTFLPRNHQSLLVYISETKDTVQLQKEDIRTRLIGMIEIKRKEKLDIVDISVESYFFDEARLIAYNYVLAYLDYTTTIARRDLSTLRQFLFDEKERAADELSNSEKNIETFFLKSGKINLDNESSLLVSDLASMDSKNKEFSIEINGNKKLINLLTDSLSKIDTNFAVYINAKASESNITTILSNIAALEIKRDLETSSIKDEVVLKKIRADYDKKISLLNQEKKNQIKAFNSSFGLNTPEERISMSTKILELKLSNATLAEKISLVKNYIAQSESKLKNYPQEIIELARLRRENLANENLYGLIRQKYQEALINERSKIGNAYIVNPGMENFGPVKPNRFIINLQGILIGILISVIFCAVRYLMDKSIKNPEEVENLGATLLAWIPSVEELRDKDDIERVELIADMKRSSSSEAFKALRTRIQFSKLDKNEIKTILVTSSVPGEGKTFIASNLANTFAQTNKNVLLLDCDLRKPRVHNVFKAERVPGMSDYLFQSNGFDEILRNTNHGNFKYITSGTIPPNPTELLASEQMKDFLELVKSKFDLIILDSPPLISVADPEILFNITDGTVLVSKANATPKDIFKRMYFKLKNESPNNLLGCVLNDFDIKQSYGYYYDYYYYYSHSGKDKLKRTKPGK